MKDLAGFLCLVTFNQNHQEPVIRSSVEMGKNGFLVFNEASIATQTQL